MTDQSYFRLRAETQARLAINARRPDVRAIHEDLCNRYLQRADTVTPTRQPAT